MYLFDDYVLGIVAVNGGRISQVLWEQIFGLIGTRLKTVNGGRISQVLWG